MPVLFGALLLLLADVGAAQSPGGREPVEAQLARQVPALMRAAAVPGVSIAYVRDGRVVWTGAYGVTNSIARRPVRPATPFSVASNGKPIAAFAALRLVDAGHLRLDEPLARLLPVPFAAHDSGRVTLRHVLTHSSGLSNYLMDRERRLRFEPGERFEYSGVGYMYLQAAIEAVTGSSLDATARALVFEPLGMRSASYERFAAGLPFARGHITLGDALAPAAILFVPVSALLLLALLALRRVAGAPGLRTVIVLACGAGATAAFLFMRIRAGSSIMPLYFLGCLTAFAALALGLGALAARLTRSRSSRPDRRWHRYAFAAVAAGLALGYGRSLPVPLPDYHVRGGNAASSLRANASDLARFMIAVGSGELLSAELARAMTSPQIRASADDAWGLGIGIQQRHDRETLWSWGSNPGSRSLMVYDPRQRDGVVVLTNGGNGSRLMREIAALALRTAPGWTL
jgi:CubicO group peptidase (beta-lactamase class C family)